VLDGTSSTAETATLAAVAPSTETGTATLTDTGSGMTQIAITTANVTDTGVQTAVMRTGTCGSNGAVFAILNNVQADESITTVPDDLSTLTGGKYYIDISLSTDVTNIVACGEIP
jgi:uridine phosphorylase